MAEVGRAVPSAPQARPGALDYYMRKSAQSAKIFGKPPERGHSCPQQLPNTQQDRNVRELYFRSTMLRTRTSALRFGSGSAGLGTAAPYLSSLTRYNTQRWSPCGTSLGIWDLELVWSLDLAAWNLLFRRSWRERRLNDFEQPLNNRFYVYARRFGAVIKQDAMAEG